MSSEGVVRWRSGLALSVLATAAALAHAQQAASSGDPAKPAISDAERAKRDADKVFQWIKFHAEKGEARKAAESKPVEKPVEKPVAKPKPRSEPEPEARAVASKPVEPPSASPSPGVAAAVVNTSAAAGTLPQPAAPQPLAGGATSPSPAGGAAMAATSPAPAQLALAAPKSAPPSPPPVDDELHLLRKVEPEYPRQALASQRSGAVQVNFTVQPDGSVRDVSAARGPDRRLTQAAVVAVQQWRFAPITRPRQVSVEFGFQVE